MASNFWWHNLSVALHFICIECLYEPYTILHKKNKIKVGLLGKYLTCVYRLACMFPRRKLPHVQ